MTNKLLSFFSLIFFISLISANGLAIEGDSIFVINKTVGNDETIIFTVKNTDSFTFYNISFEENDIIHMSNINELTSGATKNVTAIITRNVDTIQNIIIKGYYESDLGVSNETYVIDVDYNDGISDCNLVAIQGDHIIWQNFVNDDIKLINADTTNEIATIAENSSYTLNFDTPQVLNYYILRRGFQFTDNCQVVALGSSGLINNPALDTSIFLDIDVNYEPTELSTTFIDTSYTMDFNDEVEGVFTIKNIGNNTAKNVELIGDWFSFSPSKFDLSVGNIKGITYKIKPIVISTNETNKTHFQNISIKGNFQTIIQPMDIFINYVDIDSGNYSIGLSLNDLLNQYCLDNPDICNPTPQIVYRDSNDSEVNVTTSTRQLKEIFGFMFELGDRIEDFENFVKEDIDIILSDSNITKYEMARLANKLEDSESTVSNSTTFLTFAFVVVVLIVVGALAGWLIYDHKKRKKIEKLRRI